MATNGTLNLATKLETHEEICAMRYEMINARLKRIEGIMIKASGIMLVSMAAVIWATMSKV
jgi:hypothetical protein